MTAPSLHSSTTLPPGRRRALRAARGKTLQRLFADEFDQCAPQDPDLSFLLQWDGDDPVANAFRDRLYSEIRLRKGELDQAIEGLSKGWSLERLTRIDRNILRIGLCEILFFPEIPFRVSVNEALELAHQFSEPEAVSFINGILHEAGVRFVPQKGPFEPSQAATKRTLGRVAGAKKSAGEGRK